MKMIIMQIDGDYCYAMDSHGIINKIKNTGNYSVGDKIEYKNILNHLNKNFLRSAAAVIIVCIVFIPFMMNFINSENPEDIYVNIEINPSILIVLKSDCSIKELKGLNQDGEDLIENITFKKKNLDKLLFEIYTEAENEGYFLNGEIFSSVAISSNEAVEYILNSEFYNSRFVLKNNDIDFFFVDKNEWGDVNNLTAPPAKTYLIKKLAEKYDLNVAEEALVSLSVKDITEYFDEIVTSLEKKNTTGKDEPSGSETTITKENSANSQNGDSGYQHINDNAIPLGTIAPDEKISSEEINELNSTTGTTENQNQNNDGKGGEGSNPEPPKSEEKFVEKKSSAATERTEPLTTQNGNQKNSTDEKNITQKSADNIVPNENKQKDITSPTKESDAEATAETPALKKEESAQNNNAAETTEETQPVTTEEPKNKEETISITEETTRKEKSNNGVDGALQGSGSEAGNNGKNNKKEPITEETTENEKKNNKDVKNENSYTNNKNKEKTTSEESIEPTISETTETTETTDAADVIDTAEKIKTNNGKGKTKD